MSSARVSLFVSLVASLFLPARLAAQSAEGPWARTAILALAPQTPTPGAGGDSEQAIIVTGQRLTGDQARVRAAAFVRQVGVARGMSPVARWVEPVCPRIRGIADHYAGIVAARMRAVAEAAGMQVGREGCEPNISVSFVGDAAALMREIDRRAPGRLREVPRIARAALLNGDAPIRWWYLTETVSNRGSSSARQTIAVGGDSRGGGTPTEVGAEGIQHYGSSVISTLVNRVIVDANVVIDLDRAEGVPLEAIAAYAAMVAFAEVWPSDPAPADSILGLFSAQPAPRGFTDWDSAFLRGLYRIPLDRDGRRHQSLLVREMTNRLRTE